MLINAILCADEKQNEATQQQGSKTTNNKQERPSKRPWPVDRRPEKKGLVS